ncbi:hypothetical protein [Phreatobacter sp.]|uniref:hypothetical protein n=1 Tax=Phreatobacter sp. TaxID=1966341 RepID=UPI003F70F5BB
MRAARHYDLGPTQISVEADHSDLLDGFDRFLGERGGSTAPACTFSITIRTGDPGPLPADAERLYSGPLLNEGQCDFARTGETYFMSFAGEARMAVDLRARRSDIVVSRDHPWRAYGSMVPIAVEFALDLEDQQVVHAAGLSLPDEAGMILVSAPSGTGKTTTALALARCGFALAADDIVVLRRTGNAVVAMGLPRALHVHRDTAAMLPWLALRPQWNDQGEQMVPRRALSPAVSLEDRVLPVRRLVLLQRGPCADIQPLSAADMLVALASDNVRGSASGLTPLQHRRYAMLADLVRSVPACRLTVAAGLVGMQSIARHVMRG